MGNIKKVLILSAGLALMFGRYPVSWFLSSRRGRRTPLRRPPVERHFINCPDGNVFYAEIDGPEHAQPIVFLHGLGASIEQWPFQIAYFKDQYRVVLVDLPGHGRAPKPVDLSIDRLASGLAEVIGHLGLKNPVLYGHSMGSMVIMSYCIRNDHDVKAVVLQHGSFTDPLKTCQYPMVMQLAKLPLIVPFLHFVKRNSLVFRVNGWLCYLSGLSLFLYRYLFFTGEQSAYQLRLVSKILARTAPEVLAEGLLQCFKFNVRKDLPKIAIPALVLGAGHDRVIRSWANRIIASNIPAGRFKQVGAGHQSLLEVPDQVNGAIGDFLNHLSPTLPLSK
ncbi:alpha/beta fold hydrolase [Hufsiella ginkgonis]|uniref:Alpha/beta fold hydrolase n=1 Tax=Hufsiella ginkgonis TaxID=2695274 RepID=A0A7K1Y0A6_9SPHI|nr:alpha/beta hydrolase [Hufsiella ginkgonis]MXV16632.1 alpha/beta fold hydrolase [Hufsiella ginkgonis]